MYSPLGATSMLGIAQHPWVQSIWASCQVVDAEGRIATRSMGPTFKHAELCNQITYHLDEIAQFGDLSHIVDEGGDDTPPGDP